MRISRRAVLLAPIVAVAAHLGIALGDTPDPLPPPRPSGTLTTATPDLLPAPRPTAILTTATPDLLPPRRAEIITDYFGAVIADNIGVALMAN